MCNHNAAAKKHTIQRAKERYGIVWTFDDINMICGWIALKKNALFLKKVSGRDYKDCELWAIVWENQLVKVVYDGTIGTLRTVFKTTRNYGENFKILLEEIYLDKRRI